MSPFSPPIFFFAQSAIRFEATIASAMKMSDFIFRIAQIISVTINPIVQNMRGSEL